MTRMTTGIALFLLALNGALHGIWTHRWNTWSDAEIQSTVARIEGLPLELGEWSGQRADFNPLTDPEELVGRGVTVQYRSRMDDSIVSVYLACGPTDGLIGHTPPACYPANGYLAVPPDLRISPGEGPVPQFWVSNFIKPDPATPTYLRVFWAWSDGSGWQVPGNARRTFRQEPVIYKCYFIRQLIAQNEPIDGDPCLRLMTVLLPRIDSMLSNKP